MLHVVFALDRRLNFFVVFKVNMRFIEYFFVNPATSPFRRSWILRTRSFVTPTYKTPLGALANVNIAA